MTTNNHMNILCISLGCDKNLVDSEMMLGQLRDRGYYFTDEEEEADVILINTCAFIGDAKEESVNTILAMAGLKENGRLKALIVTGCLSERYREEILQEIPEVDAILGTSSFMEIADVLDRILSGESHLASFGPLDSLPEETERRILSTGGVYAFLKIAEGCNKRCTYCIIPYLRGRYRSFPMAGLLSDARKMAEEGVRELILVAQETTLYGTDLSGQKMLPALLRGLSRIPGLKWVRLQYCYPEEITEELIETIRDAGNVCHYLDIPIQHASDDVLRRMGRRTTRKEITERIRRIREMIPDIVLRTTLISGFPGETEEDHRILMDFVREIRFDRLGVFAYSQEEDTPAAEYPDQVPEEIRERRRDEIMALQQEIAFEKAEEQIGREMEVLIEGRLADEEDNVYVGRTYMDAPDVDGQIFVRTDRNLMSGDFIRVMVTESSEYDLIGEEIDESAE